MQPYRHSCISGDALSQSEESEQPQTRSQRGSFWVLSSADVPVRTYVHPADVCTWTQQCYRATPAGHVWPWKILCRMERAWFAHGSTGMAAHLLYQVKSINQDSLSQSVSQSLRSQSGQDQDHSNE